MSHLTSTLGRAAAFLVLAAAFGSCLAAGASQTMLVSARVLRYAAIRVSPPASFNVSDADLARGFAVVAAPLALQVQSNVPAGYSLRFEKEAVHVLQAHVDLDGRRITVADAAVLAMRTAPGRGMWHDQVELRFRFDLAQGIAAGEHPWPLRISMASE
jgi:hypothetical protein